MWADVRAAFSFLTILPLGYGEARKPGWSFAAYPLVGLSIGAILAITAALLPYNAPITAFVVVAAWVIVTGGLHLDGLGDSCDGLLATVTPARRLEIMKDPRAGMWAVVGLILLLLGKWTAIQSVPPLVLLIPPILGRCGMVLAVYSFPYARAGGLGGYFRDGLSRVQVGIAALCALALVLVAAVWIDRAVLVTMPVMLAVVYVGGRWAAARLGGGLTGDVYGALCEVTELLCLLGLSLWASG
jgi:adenosylcobinamide-GDP ribazoletransferase